MRGSVTGVLLLGLSLAACGATQTPVPARSAPPEGFETVGKGDLIEVKVFREPELDGVFRVGAGGEIDFPLIGRVEVVGQLPEEVAATIRARLAGDYLKDPQVTVLVKESNSRKIHVFGQVAEAGTFPYRSGMTVIEAITSAGGFAELASPNRTRVTRVIDGVEKVYELPAGSIGEGEAPNFLLQPGDIVFVPEAVF
jgi:polysaccharide export outer membrane protein